MKGTPLLKLSCFAKSKRHNLFKPDYLIRIWCPVYTTRRWPGCGKKAPKTLKSKFLASMTLERADRLVILIINGASHPFHVSEPAHETFSEERRVCCICNSNFEPAGTFRAKFCCVLQFWSRYWDYESVFAILPNPFKIVIEILSRLQNVECGVSVLGIRFSTISMENMRFQDIGYW